MTKPPNPLLTWNLFLLFNDSCSRICPKVLFLDEMKTSQLFHICKDTAYRLSLRGKVRFCKRRLSQAQRCIEFLIFGHSGIDKTLPEAFPVINLDTDLYGHFAQELSLSFGPLKGSLYISLYTHGCGAGCERERTLQFRSTVHERSSNFPTVQY